MRIRFVDKLYEASQPGDAKYFTNGRDGDKRKIGGLLIKCPGCGKLQVIAFKPVEYPPGWDWDGDEASPTVVPSIWHSVPGCGWHGHLIAGKFVSA